MSDHEESVESTHIANEIDDITENTVQERVLHKTNENVDWSIPEHNESVDGMEVDIASSMSSADNEFHKSIHAIASSTPKRTIRYPGDINEDEEMSPKTAKRNVTLCKQKIKSQAKTIYKLKQTVRRQKKQIETLKELLKNLKTKFSLSSHAVQSIEVL